MAKDELVHLPPLRRVRPFSVVTLEYGVVCSALSIVL